MSLKNKIRAFLIGKHSEVASVHIRGDNVIHAKDIAGNAVYSLRVRDFEEVGTDLFYRGEKIS